MAERSRDFTPMTMPEVRAALKHAFRAELGDSPTPRELAMLAAHVDLETAAGQQMRGYNFGNITGKARGEYFLLEAPEFIDGEWVQVEQPYRWYPSPLAGAADYIRFLRTQYPTAFSRLSSTPRAFALALKEGEPYSYYTAPLDEYTHVLQGRYVAPRGHGPGTPLLPVALALGALAFTWWRATR